MARNIDRRRVHPRKNFLNDIFEKEGLSRTNSEMEVEEDQNDSISEKNFEELKRNISRNAAIIGMNILPSRIGEKRKSVFLIEKLLNVEEQLKAKEEQCNSLTNEQLQATVEIQELTASLFEEANKMVADANLKKLAAEKKLNEANSKIEVLQAEVEVFKKRLSSLPDPASIQPSSLVPSTPSLRSEFIKGHRRSASHHDVICQQIQRNDSFIIETDPEFKEMFLNWISNPSLSSEEPFISSLLSTDVRPCLKFPNKQLSEIIEMSIFDNTLFVEPLNQLLYENECSLCEKMTTCRHKIKFENSQNSYPISSFARNRVISVCDLVSFLRYITLGLVKHQSDEMFRQIILLLKNINLARIGLME